jgi:hypothetical protein
MIQLALEVLAFLFLCFVGLVLLAIVFGILGAIGDALRKLFAATPPTPRTGLTKTPFALGHDPIEPNHDPRSCPLCLGRGHPPADSDLYARAPRGMSTDELHTWAAQERERESEDAPEQEREKRQIEAAHQKSQFKHVPGLPWGDPSSYVRGPIPEQVEHARESNRERKAEEREREIEAIQCDFSTALKAPTSEELERARRETNKRDAIAAKERDDEKREREAREFLVRESERVLKEREEREAAKKQKLEQEQEREAEENRSRWVN